LPGGSGIAFASPRPTNKRRAAAGPPRLCRPRTGLHVTYQRGQIMAATRRSTAEALTRAHLALRKDLGLLEEAARPASGEGAAALRTRLGATRTHVTEHFRFEEDGGYLDAVRKGEPRLERAVQQLAEEHRQLARSLDALVEEARADPRPDDAFRGRVRAWIEQLRKHEARENELIQDAFSLDIGAED
jgi:hypothetical protein